MKFNYQKYGPALRPVIKIKLKSNSKSFIYEALIDSGADVCLFHSEAGEALGLDIKQGEMRRLIGVGGKSALYYLHNIEIEIAGWTYKIQAGFMPDVGGKIIQHGLLGQKGFFENFIVKFDYKKEEIELKPRG